MLSETSFSSTIAFAPELTWMPFCAISTVGPIPLTEFSEINACEPVLEIVIPFFWYLSMRFVGDDCRSDLSFGKATNLNPDSILTAAQRIVPDVCDVIATDQCRAVHVNPYAVFERVAQTAAGSSDCKGQDAGILRAVHTDNGLRGKHHGRRLDNRRQRRL